MGFLFLFVGCLILVILVIIIKKHNEEKEQTPVEKEQAKQKEKADSIERWDKMYITNGVEHCKRCSKGQLVYSHSNMNLRPDAQLEYFYCLTCKMDTSIGKVA